MEEPIEEKPVETLRQQRIREELGRKKKDESGFDKPPDTAIDSDKYDMANMALMDFLGIKSEDWESIRDKLAVVREWAEVTARSVEKVEILSAIKYLENNVVEIGLEENRLNALYRWIRLDLDQKRIEQEKELYQK